jgi:hypothetical protein
MMKGSLEEYRRNVVLLGFRSNTIPVHTLSFKANLPQAKQPRPTQHVVLQKRCDCRCKWPTTLYKVAIFLLTNY